MLYEVAHELEVPVVGRAVESGLLMRGGVGSVDVEAELDHQLHRVGPVLVGSDTDLVQAPGDRAGNDRRVARPEPIDRPPVGAHARAEELELGIGLAGFGAGRFEELDDRGVAVQNGELVRGASLEDRVRRPSAIHVDRML